MAIVLFLCRVAYIYVPRRAIIIKVRKSNMPWSVCCDSKPLLSSSSALHSLATVLSKDGLMLLE